MVVSKTKRTPKSSGPTEKTKHKFESFPQQLKNLKVPRLGIGYFSGVAGETDVAGEFDAEAEGSHFESTLQKWRDLNLSESFTLLSRKSHNLCKSFGQLLHNSEKIVELLKEYGREQAEVESCHSMEPILDLWHALANDLKLDMEKRFWPHFTDFLTVCFSAMRMKDIGVIRMSYGSICGVLKIIQRASFVTGLHLVRRVIEVLMTFKEEHRPGLPSEALKLISHALAQAIRKAKDRDDICKFLFKEKLQEPSKNDEFYGHVLIATCAMPYPNLTNWQVVVEHASNELKSGRSLDFWDQSIALLGASYADAYKEFSDHLASTLINRKNVGEHEVKLLRKLAATNGCNHHFSDVIWQWSNTLWLENQCTSVTFETWKELFQSIITSLPNNESGKGKLETIANNFSLTKFLTLSEKCDIFSVTPKNFWGLDVITGQLVGWFDSKGADYFTLVQAVISLRDGQDWESSFFKLSDKVIKKMLTQIESLGEKKEFENANRFLRCLIHFKPCRIDDILSALQPVEDHLDSVDEELMLNVIRMRKKCLRLSNETFLSKAITILSRKKEISVESECLAMICTSNPTLVKKVIGKVCPDINIKMVDCLSHAERQVRLNMLKSLHALDNNNEVLEALLRSENVQPDVGTYRERLRHLGCLSLVENSSQLVQECYIRCVIANFCEDFMLLWKPCIEILVDCEQKLDAELFWKVSRSIFVELIQKGQDTNKGEENARNKLLESFTKMSSISSSNCAHLVDVYLDHFSSESTELPKGYGKTTQLFFQLFTKFSHHLGTKSNKLNELSFDLLKHKESSLQTTALNFICVLFKKVKTHQSILQNLCDPLKGKAEFRSLKEKIKDSDLNLHLRRVLICITVGCLKRTSKEKAKKQKDTRKIILESCAMVSKEFLFDTLKMSVENCLAAARVDGSNYTGKYDMLVDLCLYAMNLVEQKHKSEVDVWLISLLVQSVNCNEEKLTVSKFKSKTLINLSKVFKTCKNLSVELLAEHKFFENCIYPLCSDGIMAITGKVVKLFDLWLGNGSFEYFLTKFNNDLTLVSVIASNLKQNTEADPKLVDFCSTLVVELEEKSQWALDELSRPLASILCKWLQSKVLKSSVPVKVSIRFEACRVMLEKNTLADENKELLGIRLASTTVSLTEENVSQWYQAVSQSLTENKIPEKLFKFLSTLKNGEYRYKLGMLLQKRLSFSGCSKKYPLEPHQLIYSPDWTRYEMLFAVYTCFAFIHANSIEKTGQGLNSLVDTLERLKETSEEEFNYICQHHVEGPLKRGLKQKDEVVHNAFITLLQFLTKHLNRGAFKELKQLCDPDEDEVDYFENMKHLQLHRRGRALRRLKKMLDEKKVSFTNTTINGYIAPMSMRFILNFSYVSHSDLVEASIQLLGSISAHLSPAAYLKLLDQFISHESTERPMKKQKFLVLSTLLESYQFEDAKIFESKKSQMLMSKCLRLLKEDEEDGSLHVFAPIAKLASFQASADTFVQTVMVEACNKLRSREFKSRQLVRTAIAEIMKVLGPNYLYFLITTLETSLQKGYQKHVLVYSVNHILSKMEEELTGECVEPIVSRCLELVSSELYADFAKEKKVAAIIKKTPEAKNVSSFQILRIIARFVDKSYLAEVLQGICPVKRKSVLIDKSRKALQHIMMGLIQNENVNAVERIALAQFVMSDKIGGRWVVMGANAKSILFEFGLNLILTELRNGFSIISEIQTITLVAIEALDFAELDVILVALKIVAMCLTVRQLQEFMEQEKIPKKLGGKMCTFLRRYSRSKDNRPFILTCKVVEKILVRFKNCFSKDELALLKTICLTELEKYPVECARILSALADVATPEENKEMSQSMCKTYVTSCQKKVHECLGSLLRQKGQKSFSLQFMMQNMEYDLVEGRQRAILFLNSHLESKQKIEANFLRQLFFLSTNQLVNEEHNDVRADLESLIVSILKQENYDKGVLNVRQSVLDWSDSPKPLHLLLASKMAILTSKSGNYELCSKIIGNLKPIAMKDETDKSTTVVHVHLFEAMTNLVQSDDKKASNLDKWDDELFEKIISSTLHPNKAVREKVIGLIAACMARKGEKKFNKWSEQETCHRLLINMHELMKKFPSGGKLNQIFVGLWKNCFDQSVDSSKNFLERLFKTFNYEKAELSQEYERRKAVLDIVDEIQVPQELALALVLPMLVRNQHVQELDEQITEMLKKFENEWGKETFLNACKGVSVRRKSLLAGQKRSAVPDQKIVRKKKSKY